jgi:hypothetical protein
MKPNIMKSSNIIPAKLIKCLAVGYQCLGLYKMELSIQSLTFLTLSIGICSRDPIYC